MCVVWDHLDCSHCCSPIFDEQAFKYVVMLYFRREMVKWSLNGEMIVAGASSNFEVINEATLLISQVDPTSAGMYTCTHPSFGSYNATVSIRGKSDAILEIHHLLVSFISCKSFLF